DDKEDKVAAVEIDFDGMEQRMVVLPPAAGNLGSLAAANGKIVFMRYPYTGESGGKAALKYYDIDKREEKTILANADDFRMSEDHKKILVANSGAYSILEPTEGAKFEKPIRTGEMMVFVDPRQEWKQLFTDAWRLERDFFYDKKMHGVTR
ncbi:MAG: peptidase S41, partial [Moraxellaceae bacterium]